MKYPMKLSNAMHILAFIYINPKNDLSSATIAVSVHTNPAYVRQIMADLKMAGILNNTQGHANPTFRRPADKITLLDVYSAVEGDKPLIHIDTNINPDCNVGVNIQRILQEKYQMIQKDAEESMRKVTLEQIVDEFHKCTKDQSMRWD